MPIVQLTFNIQNGGPLDADQVMANLNDVVAVLNGNIDSTNVVADVPAYLDSQGGPTAGDSLGLALANHKHVLRGMEPLAADPTTGNFPGRKYYDTTNNRGRQCIAVDSTGIGTWVTYSNLQAGDLPAHAARHASGGPDALPDNSVTAAMLSRTLTTGAMSSSTISVSASAWTDVITGVTPTITGTQPANVTARVAYGNSSASNVKVLWRLIDQASSVLAQTGPIQTGAVSGPNDQHSYTLDWKMSFSATPTLKLQIFADGTGITVNKTSTSGGSTGTCTQLDVLVG